MCFERPCLPLSWDVFLLTGSARISSDSCLPGSFLSPPLRGRSTFIAGSAGANLPSVACASVAGASMPRAGVSLARELSAVVPPWDACRFFAPVVAAVSSSLTVVISIPF